MEQVNLFCCQGSAAWARATGSGRLCCVGGGRKATLAGKSGGLEGAACLAVKVLVLGNTFICKR